MQGLRRVIVWGLTIGMALRSPDCFARGDVTASEGSCSAYDPDACENPKTELDVNDAIDSECHDENELCSYWASLGECDENPGYMLRSCKRSCLLCSDQVAELQRKLDEKQKENANNERVWTNEELYFGEDIGEKQNLENTNFHVQSEEGSARIIQSRAHVYGGKLDDDTIEICKNEHVDCTVWAIAGECEKNKKYMVKSCAPACFTCDMLLLENRCPVDPNAKPAWEPGDLNAMFERLTSEEINSKYPVTILSKDPWVVTLDDVISEEEALRLIDLGGLEGYKRSEDVGEKKKDGTYGSIVSTGRTSSNAWCLEACYEDPMVKDVMNRLSGLTMIDEKNSEYLQLLQYEPGQFYEDHHDYIIHNIDNMQGVRILTAYLYLNDVEAGGGTRFTDLDITVMPKRGRALFWPSVLNEYPHEKDGRTNHQALPVEAGVKYGANGWYHQFDFKTPFENACTG